MGYSQKATSVEMNEGIEHCHPYHPESREVVAQTLSTQEATRCCADMHIFYQLESYHRTRLLSMPTDEPDSESWAVRARTCNKGDRKEFLVCFFWTCI